MARRGRVWFEGACYHVMARGIRKMPIFLTVDDQVTFMGFLEKLADKMDFVLHAYCLMTNHIHLQITSNHVPIWSIMQRLLGTYAMYFNRTHHFKGHLFEGRYISRVISSPVYFLKVNRYIHLNPVKAGIVTRPEDYVFSSYQCYIGKIKNRIVDVDKVLSYFSAEPNPKEAYIKFVEEGCHEPDDDVP